MDKNGKSVQRGVERNLTSSTKKRKELKKQMKTNELNMEATIYTSETVGRPENCIYAKSVVVKDLTSAKEAFSHDYVCAEYVNSYRAIKNFVSSKLLPFDIDNDHTDDESKWFTPEKVAEFFEGVPFIVHYSKNHMKEKNGRKPRPKFHIIFPIREITSEKEYSGFKARLHKIFPIVDGNALDSARFFNGTKEPLVEFYGGTKRIDEFIEEYEKATALLFDDSIPEGKRNDAMLSFAVKVLKRDGNTEGTRELYRKESERCKPPLSKQELNTVWKQALKYYESIKANPSYKVPAEYKQGQTVIFDEILPLPDVVLPEFPTDALPERVRAFCEDVTESTQTPPDMAFVSALGILALAMQRNYKVVGKADWEEQLSLYIMVIAEPSDRKSAVISQMCKVIHAFEASYNESHANELIKNHDEYARLIAKKNKIVKDIEKGKATEAEYEEIVSRIASFKILSCLTLTLDDVTNESIATKMTEQDGCIAIVSSEGGMVDIISGLYSKNVNIDVYLKGYSGDSLKVDRIGRESLYIPHPKLTILLTVQPKVLENFITNATFSGRGLTARFLYSVPKSKVGSRKFFTNEIRYESKQAFNNLVREILSEPSSPTTYIHLSGEASEKLKDFYDYFEKRLATDLKEIGSWAGKLCGNILRFSAILTRARGVKYSEFTGKESTESDAVWIVQKEDMENAIRLGNYFLSHAECAFNLLGVDQQTKDAKTLVKLLRERKERLSELNARIVARMTNKLGKKDRINGVLSMLADYGYLKEKVNTYEYGRPKSETYLINPKIYDNDGEPP